MTKHIEFFIDDMTCAACKGTCEKALIKAGAQNVAVNLATKKAVMDIDTDKLSEDILFSAIKKVGFTPRAIDKAAKNQKRRYLLEKIRLTVSLVFAAVLLYAAMVPMFAPSAGIINPETNPIGFAALQLALVLPVMICGYKFYTKGYLSLFRRKPNMDSLVAVGTTAAFAYSLYACIMVFMGNAHYVHSLYFESVAVIIALVMLGKFLEARALKKTGDAVAKLMDITPHKATVLRNGKELVLDISDIVSGDTVVLHEGEAVAVDGEAVWGTAYIDESMLTGEPLPAEKTEGAQVFAGTINTNGLLHYRAEKIGRDTVISNIVRAVENAQNSKAKIEKVADRVAGIFTPAVMLIALITFIVWISVTKNVEQSLTAFISVLVISCPCALGLATPVAIIAGTGRAASGGVLFKNADAFSHLAKAKIVCFDKTGTITEGKPQVDEIILLDKTVTDDQSLLLAYAAAAESGSTHPLAKAVIKKAEETGVAVPASENFSSYAGFGVSATVNGKTVKAGKAEFFGLTEEERNGTAIYIQIDGVLSGKLLLSDAIAEGSAETVAKLKQMGIKTVMITGDNRSSAELIAQRAGIDEVYANVLPEEKADIVKELKKQGYVVFCGDGVNDAPALASADAGIAVSGGSDIATSSADAVLTRKGLSGVSFAISLGKAVSRNIRENLIWAFVYNVIGIPVAAGVLYPAFGDAALMSPMIAALAMSLSSICVLLNALRLTVFKQK